MFKKVMFSWAKEMDKERQRNIKQEKKYLISVENTVRERMMEIDDIVDPMLSKVREVGYLDLDDENISQETKVNKSSEVTDEIEVSINQLEERKYLFRVPNNIFTKYENYMDETIKFGRLLLETAQAYNKYYAFQYLNTNKDFLGEEELEVLETLQRESWGRIARKLDNQISDQYAKTVEYLGYVFDEID
ncbi:hypothetical protein BTO30_07160 [Domibacillus antri]|uniref:Uncharacterized protein n=1 Tax=Domibacillus antri TaxID=1714264 RepID=A0A1Q8Q6D9_9BACI|nr:hypothetical protein [Domibacillus antri]OLN22916.1 hypothetical protein BTO30_07160 [Domibacillus antri]